MVIAMSSGESLSDLMELIEAYSPVERQIVIAALVAMLRAARGV